MRAPKSVQLVPGQIPANVPSRPGIADVFQRNWGQRKFSTSEYAWVFAEYLDT